MSHSHSPRILHVMAGAAAGGAETAYAELVSAQKSAGFDVHAACRPSTRNDLLKNAGVPLTELPFGGFFDFRTKPALTRLMDTVKPDIALTWMNRAAKKLPKNTGAKWIARLGGYYDLKYYRGVDHFIVNAPDIGRWMQERGVPADKITFIPNFAEVPPQAAPVSRADFSTPDDAFVFLSLSRLHVNKGLDTMLAAFANVPDAILWVAGEGPDRAALEKQAADLGISDRVRFLGWRDDRWNLLAACDAFVMPSRHEPFGNSFMQCWAAGKPLVTTASQGPSYYVQDGEDALVTPIDDVSALSDAMNKIRQDSALRTKIAQNGKIRYAQVFDKQEILNQWRRVFDRVVKAA